MSDRLCAQNFLQWHHETYKYLAVFLLGEGMNSCDIGAGLISAQLVFLKGLGKI